MEFGENLERTFHSIWRTFTAWGCASKRNRNTRRFKEETDGKHNKNIRKRSVGLIMQSLTMLEEIISEVRLHNPNATPQEISEGITAVLGKEILPEILKNLSLHK